MLLKKFLFVYIVLFVLCLVGVVLASTIPSPLMKQHVRSSLITLKTEGQYPSFGFPWRQIVLDNFTDSLMLNTAYSVDARDPLRSALVNKRYDGTTDSINQISNLEKLYSGRDIQEVYYERYWHGHSLYVRPLLSLMPYEHIRIVLTGSLYVLAIALLVVLWKNIGKFEAISMLIGLIAIDFLYLGQSMQFSSVFIVGLCGALYMLASSDDKKEFQVLFFVIGSLTSFMDLLTAPLVSLGFLLIVAMHLKKQTLRQLFYLCIAWSCGYLLLWASKWVLVEALYSPGAWTAALDQIVNRTVHKADANFSQFKAIKLNIFQLIGYHKSNKVFVAAAALVLGLIGLRYMRFNMKTLHRVAPWAFIAAIPYVWYFIAANHSYLHVWFTYRNQCMTVVAGLCIYRECLNTARLQKDISTLRSHFTSKHTSGNC